MSDGRTLGRRMALAAATGFAIPWLVSRESRAETVPVPPLLQAKLTAKIAAFDRGMPGRAGSVVRVLLVTRPGDPMSDRVAREFAMGLKDIPAIAGLPHDDAEAVYSSASNIVAQVRDGRYALVYFSAGFATDAAVIGQAFRGLDVLTASAEPIAVARGMAVGFDLVSGQPKVLVNLNQARAQRVALPGALLSLALLVGGA